MQKEWLLLLVLLMLISSPQYGNLRLLPLDNDNTGNHWPPGTAAHYCEQEFGTLVIRNYNAGQFRIRHVLFNLIKTTSFLFQEEKPQVRNRLVLEGDFWMKSKNRKRQQIKPGQLLLIHAGDREETLHFEKEGHYGFLDTMYSATFLHPLLSSFPSLASFFHHPSSAKDLKKITRPRFALPETTRIAHNLLQCPYDPGLRRLYFEIKMRDYLFQSFVQAQQAGKAVDTLQQKQQEAVHLAHRIILSDITRHITIKDISSQVRLNEKKLKRNFKEVFGMGIYECLLQARMERARELLLTTDKPIKEIASLCGFDYLTNFATAFRKYFGDTPGDLRS